MTLNFRQWWNETRHVVTWATFPQGIVSVASTARESFLILGCANGSLYKHLQLRLDMHTIVLQRRTELLLQLEDNLRHTSCAAVSRRYHRGQQTARKCQKRMEMFPHAEWENQLEHGPLPKSLLFISFIYLFLFIFYSRWKPTLLLSEWDCPQRCQMSFCCVVDTRSHWTLSGWIGPPSVWFSYQVGDRTMIHDKG